MFKDCYKRAEYLQFLWFTAHRLLAMDLEGVLGNSITNGQHDSLLNDTVKSAVILCTESVPETWKAYCDLETERLLFVLILTTC